MTSNSLIGNSTSGLERLCVRLITPHTPISVSCLKVKKTSELLEEEAAVTSWCDGGCSTRSCHVHVHIVICCCSVFRLSVLKLLLATATLL